MSEKINLVLGVHNHLPNGTTEDEFENLYNQKIRPLVSALYQFPRINMVFHYSGVLFHWIERRHPELFVLIDDLLSRKQIELLGGGFYEPMMPLLPLADRIGQIEMLTTYLRKQFGKRPQGCWFPSNAWEQNLTAPLCSCGMNYTFLDESGFSAAGAVKKASFFYEPCITEDQGKIITVFPVMSSLEKNKPAGILEKLLSLPAGCEGPLTVFPSINFQTGEKSETEYQHFFEELSGAAANIEFTTPGRIFRLLTGLKRLYFSGNISGSNPKDSAPRQFMTEYPEAGNIYAKMIHTRMLINQLRGDKARKHAALDELWKAQDSAVYCPRGLGNSMVRKAAYTALIEAGKITQKNGSVTPSLSFFDYNLDGADEYVFQDEKLSCYVKERGASLFELDYLPASSNYLDTFTGPKNSGESRGSFADYLFPGKTPPSPGFNGINGAFFCGNETFEAAEVDRVHRQMDFRLVPKDGPFSGIEIKKSWRLKKNVITVQYELKNNSRQTEDFFLVPTIDFSFSGGNDSCLKIFALRASRESVSFSDQKEIAVNNVNGLEFRDLKNEIVLILESSGQFDAGLFMVETPLGDDSSGDVTGNPSKNPSPAEYQFTCVMPIFRISLDPGKPWENGFSVKISS